MIIIIITRVDEIPFVMIDLDIYYFVFDYFSFSNSVMCGFAQMKGLSSR